MDALLVDQAFFMHSLRVSFDIQRAQVSTSPNRDSRLNQSLPNHGTLYTVPTAAMANRNRQHTQDSCSKPASAISHSHLTRTSLTRMFSILPTKPQAISPKARN